MTNTELLMKYIKDSGLKLQYIAEKMGISRSSLNNKICNRTEFRIGEVESLCAILGISSIAERHKVFFWHEGR